MVPFLIVTAIQCHSATPPPCLVSEAALIPADTVRVILASLHSSRDAVALAHQEGFDCLIDNLERALGEPHASTLRALLQEGLRT